MNAGSGYFVKDGLAIGATLGYGLSVLNEANVSFTSVRLSPLLRYYFLSEEPVYFYFDLRPGLALIAIQSDFDDDSQADFIFQGGPGMSVFLSRDVSVDVGLNYFLDPNFTGTSTSRIGLNVGLQVFINNTKED